MRFNRAWRLLVAAVLFLSLNFILSPRLRAAVNQNIELNSGWEFNQLTDTKEVAIPEKWRAAVVPGDVHLDLLRYKLIPLPFYRDN